MAGYDYGAWKSNNAVDAENNGLLKAGELAAALGVSSAAVRAHAIAKERHHVGGGYAMLAYYDRRQPESAVELMEAYDAQVRPRTILAATVAYLEWPTFRVGRWAKNRNNKPREIVIEGCAVTLASANTIIIDPAGRNITKRTTTKGLRIVDSVTKEVVIDASAN